MNRAENSALLRLLPDAEKDIAETLNSDPMNKEIFEVEIVLLRTQVVKRNVGSGTPTEYLLILEYE
ncbi:hypothetical protein [Mediterraneibacter gnavus]|uniref:hypothetical protein n=1 Tax=Mediterraneibacter gnavus TaxID=33038 RepID=UPI00232DC34B|nr:hypothetical protein [Mediterraneibacter gnavus]MDB8712133.1 hypothetical protein [Mediterraneibacter gnavus]MDB8715170.1 hypothetical protein [Mediterraneibacter gnavus]